MLKKVFKKITNITLFSALATNVVGMTFCAVPPQLQQISNLVFDIAKWAGGIITFVGVVMVAKAFMDSSSGHEQPGALGKALGVAVLGAMLLAGSTLLNGIV